jgi:diguanylate cyclase (GGDEF)-like protein
MDLSPSDPQRPAAGPAFRPPARTFLLLLAMAVSLLILSTLTLKSDNRALRSVESLAALITLVAGGTLVAYEYCHWAKPTRAALNLLSEIRQGKAPIEELRKLPAGGLAPVTAVLIDLLDEIRQHEAKLARLEGEISHRVAKRTDALQRSLSSVKNQAHRDQLTGLYNRRAFEQAYPRVFDQCRAACTDLYVLMIDLDRFKSVNDTLGHPVGDTLIGDVGNLIRSHVRDTDFAFRYGGDEFLLLLPGVNFDAARTLADRLMQLGGQLGQALCLRPAPGLSVGLASLLANPGFNSAELLKAADESLYSTKTARRSA